MAKFVEVLLKGVVKKVPEKTAKMMERYYGAEILVDELPAGVAPPRPILQQPKIIRPAAEKPQPAAAAAGDPLAAEQKAATNPNEPTVIPPRTAAEKAPVSAKKVTTGKPKKAKSHVAANK